MVGGVAGGVGLLAAGGVVGYGNMLKMGAAWGGSAVAAGATTQAISKWAGYGAERAAAHGAIGRRWGGRVGMAAAGLGILTGLI